MGDIRKEKNDCVGMYGQYIRKSFLPSAVVWVGWVEKEPKKERHRDKKLRQKGEKQANLTRPCFNPSHFQRGWNSFEA